MKNLRYIIITVVAIAVIMLLFWFSNGFQNESNEIMVEDSQLVDPSVDVTPPAGLDPQSESKGPSYPPPPPLNN